MIANARSPNQLPMAALTMRVQGLGSLGFGEFTSPGLKFRRTWLQDLVEDAEYLEVHFTWPG